MWPDAGAPALHRKYQEAQFSRLHPTHLTVLGTHTGSKGGREEGKEEGMEGARNQLRDLKDFFLKQELRLQLNQVTQSVV